MAKDPFRWRDGRLDLPGVRVGCVTDPVRRTGVTVVLLPPGSCGSAHLAGGAPATREVEALDPQHLVPGPDALVLCGGSALGLAAADGVARHLRGLGIGFPAGPVRVPIVAAAAIFDLSEGEAHPPGPEDGAAAAAAAGEGPVPEGRVGAGAGATVGKQVRGQRTPGGQGATTLVASDGLRVGALAVVNALGSVKAEDGRVLAGPRGADGLPLDPLFPWAEGNGPEGELGAHTTLGVVVTDAALDKPALARVARMAHDGMARAIEPAHTLWDGDLVFAASTGQGPTRGLEQASRVGALAARALARAIRRAVAAAAG